MARFNKILTPLTERQLKTEDTIGIRAPLTQALLLALGIPHRNRIGCISIRQQLAIVKAIGQACPVGRFAGLVQLPIREQSTQGGLGLPVSKNTIAVGTAITLGADKRPILRLPCHRQNFWCLINIGLAALQLAALKANHTLGIAYARCTHLAITGLRIAIQSRAIDLNLRIGYRLTIIQVMHPHQATGRKPLGKQTQVRLQHEAIHLPLGPAPLIIKIGVLIQLRRYPIGSDARTRQRYLGC